jgi:hypothetical protein
MKNKYYGIAISLEEFIYHHMERKYGNRSKYSIIKYSKFFLSDNILDITISSKFRDYVYYMGGVQVLNKLPYIIIGRYIYQKTVKFLVAKIILDYGLYFLKK